LAGMRCRFFATMMAKSEMIVCHRKMFTRVGFERHLRQGEIRRRDVEHVFGEVCQVCESCERYKCEQGLCVIRLV
jgi:hypothetical protein